jgi:DNA-binding CsgD family transcriptional regulator/sugar-specific transcriptional regulator TrmB
MLDVLGLDQIAEDVYRAMLANRALSVVDLCRMLGIGEQEVRAALDELFAWALICRSADHADAWRAVDPQSGLRTLLARQHAELERRRARIATAQAEIATFIAERPDGEVQGERLRGIDTVISRLEQLIETARTQLLGVTPGAAQTGASLDAARRNDARLLERGVAIRELVQDACRHDPATAAHARWLTEAGGQVRTSPTLPHRMILIDARIAIVPLDTADSRKGALQVTEPGIVGTLLALFEQIWAAAVPFAAGANPTRHGLSTRELELLRLLAAGLTDEAAAARLAISDRTVRRIMNDLCERLGAASRFEAGIKAAQAGWLENSASRSPSSACTSSARSAR